MPYAGGEGRHKAYGMRIDNSDVWIYGGSDMAESVNEDENIGTDDLVEISLDEIEGLEDAVSLGGFGFGCGCGGIFGAFCG